MSQTSRQELPGWGQGLRAVLLPAVVACWFFVALAISARFLYNDVNRVEVIESMPNGWILLDEQDKIVDVNKEGANILGSAKDLVLNQSFKKFDLNLPQWV